MRQQKWANALLVLSVVLVLISGCYWLYVSNTLNIRQLIAEKQRPQIHRTYRKTDKDKIKNLVTTNDFRKNNWTKIGVIVIPKLGISLPIYNQPYNQSALLKGAQQLKAVHNKVETDTTFGTGNVILVAHNYADGRKMFSPLQQTLNRNEPYYQNGVLGKNNWLDGQRIYCANDAGVYEYQITEQKGMNETDLNIRNDSPTAEISIITCLYPDDTKRILTKAKLERKWSWSLVPHPIANYFDIKLNPYNF